ncbi:DUF7716 domain-containing protein [Pseudomonas huanghezhanensis]|uniref:DUF7716 domain-containing protein n=1 Tax=Pseudomonas huanghezhanensis TaxID=3002903 RepID=UPI002285B2FC|nr:hypothetical protein [Pseudomonas sp. BSw22131]
MDTLKVKEPISINEIIEAIRSGYDFDDDLCLYASEEVDQIKTEIICYLDDYPEVINDEDQYSEFINKHHLHLLYYGEQFKDVMLNVLHQRQHASSDEIIKALNYYMENDDFLDLK